MAIRFRRSVKIAPGVRLNVGKKSASVRFGGKGFGVTTGTAGTRVSAGIPGTGLYVTQKVGGPTRKSTPAGSRSTVSAATQGDMRMSVKDAATSLGPEERGFGFPGWWLAGAIVCLLGAIGGAYGAVVLAVPCAYMVWRGISSARYKALKSIRTAQMQPSPEADDAVREVAASAEDSWTIQREAGLYFLSRPSPDLAVGYLAKALRSYPYDGRALAAVTATAAIDAGQVDYAVSLLEPYLAAAAPDESDLDCALLGLLGLAFQKMGDPGRALGVVGRLPLRRRNLSQSLLFGLCVRALAKHASGKKADAKRDLDRVYASDPTFSFLAEAQAVLATDVDA